MMSAVSSGIGCFWQQNITQSRKSYITWSKLFFGEIKCFWKHWILFSYNYQKIIELDFGCGPCWPCFCPKRTLKEQLVKKNAKWNLRGKIWIKLVPHVKKQKKKKQLIFIRLSRLHPSILAVTRMELCKFYDFVQSRTSEMQFEWPQGDSFAWNFTSKLMIMIMFIYGSVINIVTNSNC